MAYVAVPNTAQVELRFSQAGQNTENVLYFEYVAQPSAAELVTLGAEVMAWWQANLRALTGTHVTLREVYVTDLTTQTSPTASVFPDTNDVGTLTGTPLPNNATVAISFRTAGRGRSSRGRNYMVGLTETSLSSTLGQSINAAVAADYVEAYDVLIDTPPTDTTWVVVSRYLNGAARNPGVTTPVTAVGFADLTVDSQRRRLPGRGT